MTRHQLFRDELDSEENTSVFFRDYLGLEIISKLNGSHVEFPKWPKEFLDALRTLATVYARFFPEADHVIRADVDTKGHCPQGVQGSLFMYFGYQCSGEGKRSQYTSVSVSHDEHGFFFSTFIGGTGDEQRRMRLVQEEDPDHLVESRVIRSLEDAQRFALEAQPVIERQRNLLVAHKGIPSTAGFCPQHCGKYWRFKSRFSDEDARNLLWEYLRDRKKGSVAQDSERLWSLLSADHDYRKKLAISYIRDGIPPEDAVELSLLESP